VESIPLAAPSRARSLLIAGALLLAVTGAPAQTAEWLDKPLVPWNEPGAPVPRAPAPKGDRPTDPRCRNVVRRPGTAAERAVAGAGWSLYGKTRTDGATTILFGQASVDGMCRPWDFQAFLFVKDKFAGTLAPRPMDSRTDGALSDIRQLTATAAEVVFLRYVGADPLCCPSRLTIVRYRIESRPQGPVVVPVSARSTATG